MSLFDSINKKIMIGYTAILALLLIAAWLLITGSDAIASKNREFVDATLPTLRTIEKTDANLSNLQISAFALYGLTLNKRDFDNQLDDSMAELNQAATLIRDFQGNNSPASDLPDQVHAQISALGMIMSRSEVDWDRARDQLSLIQKTVNNLKEALGNIEQTITEQAQSSARDISAQISKMKLMLYLTIAGIGLITFMAFIGSKLTIVKPAQSLSSQLDYISAERDLTQEVIINSNDEMAITAKSVNDLVNAFRQSSTEIQTSASSLMQSVSQLNQSATLSDDQVIEFSRHIQHMLEKIDTLENSTGLSAERSSNASETAKIGADQVLQGSNDVQDTALSISQLARDIDSVAEMLLNLKQAGDQVSSVVKTIADIAEQTNLLALNAAIEAARAGESGRGFAVVADEVRTLASRTQASTHEINSILETIVDSISSTVNSMDANKAQANKAVSKAESTVASLEQIKETVTNLSENNADLATIATTARQDTLDMKNSVNQIGTASQRVTESSRDTRSASSALSELALSLEGIVGRFKV